MNGATESGSQRCAKCAGCGKIANDDDGTAWVHWLALPLESSMAVLAGIVRPIPCPECGGTGRTAPEPKPLDPTGQMIEKPRTEELLAE